MGDERFFRSWKERDQHEWRERETRVGAVERRRLAKVDNKNTNKRKRRGEVEHEIHRVLVPADMMLHSPKVPRQPARPDPGRGQYAA